MSEKNPHNLQVGQKLWYVQFTDGISVTVAKIGKKYAACTRPSFCLNGEASETFRVDLIDLKCPDRWPGGRCFLSKSVVMGTLAKEEDIKSSAIKTREAWIKLQNDFQYHQPEHLTLEKIVAIRAILENK